MDRPVSNHTRVIEDAAVVLSFEDDRVRLEFDGLSVLAEKSDAVGLELTSGQTREVHVDGHSYLFEVEGSGQLTKDGYLTFILVGRHTDGATTWEFNGHRQ